MHAVIRPAVLLLLVSCWSLPSWAQESGNQDGSFFRVIPLKYAMAAEVADILAGSISSDSVRVAADVRGNSIVLSGSGTFQLEQVMKMVESLDVAPRETQSEESRLKVFQLLHIDPEQAYRILQTMMAGKDIKLDIDERNAQVFVQGSTGDLEVIEELLGRIDVQGAGDGNREPESVYVSATLIVESAGMTDDEMAVLKKPSQRISGLLEQAAAAELFAFDNPQVVTSVVTQVGSALPDGQGDSLGEFENASQALAAGYDVMHHGYLMQMANEKMRLKSTLEIRVRGNQFQDEILSEVQTDIVARLNHPVLLSFSTIGDRDSAIIVELKSGDKPSGE